MIIYVLTF